MPRNARTTSQLGLYHVMIRGVSKQILFEDATDYRFFRNLMKHYLKKIPIQIHAYCLMENHVHILVQDTEGFLHKFMQCVEICYAEYFNSKYERVGTLFQGRFKSEPIEDARYYATVVRYIIWNPQKEGIASYNDYPWSSYRELVKDDWIINSEYCLEIFGGLENLQNFLKTPPDDKCMEPAQPRLSDRRALEVIRECLHVKSGTELQAFSREDRNAALVMLKRKKLSIRQIERLTGISRGIIARL